MAYAKVKTLIARGLEPIPFLVEASVDNDAFATYGFMICGLDESEQRSACKRIVCALKACGFTVPKNVTVNVCPQSLKPTGAQLDLAIAAAVLAASKQVGMPAYWTEYALVGALGLDGSVQPCELMHVYSRAHQFLACNPDADDVGRPIRAIVPIRSLHDLLRPIKVMHPEHVAAKACDSALERMRVSESLALAMQCAAATRTPTCIIGHDMSLSHVLLAFLSQVLPSLDLEQALLANASAQLAHKPDRYTIGSTPPSLQVLPSDCADLGLSAGQPHHFIASAIQAANGTLCLPYAHEMDAKTLRSLKHISREGSISRVGAQGNEKLPANFWLLGCAPPCPCGGFGAAQRECTCTPHAIAAYRSALSDAFPVIIEANAAFDDNGIDLYALRRAVKQAQSSRSYRNDVELSFATGPFAGTGLAKQDVEEAQAIMQARGKVPRDRIAAACMIKASADILSLDRVADIPGPDADRVVSALS